VTVPAPAGVSYRVIGLPQAQSDNTVHTLNLDGVALPGETLVLLASTSVPNIGGDAGSVTDAAGNTWTLDLDHGAPATGGFHIVQSFSAPNPAQMNIGGAITLRIKQTTVSGSVLLDAAVISVVSTSGFDSSGTLVINGVNVTYTGITANSLTGCGTHAAYVGGETVTYHGQSPFWCVLALNSGGGKTFSFDVGATQDSTTNVPSATAATTATSAVAFGLFVESTTDTIGWMTPGSGWTKLFDTYFANHRATAGDPNYTDQYGTSYQGESGYGLSVEAKILSASASISANATMSYAVASTSTLLAVYGLSGGLTIHRQSVAISVVPSIAPAIGGR
jgi:hypothetical protein